MDTENEKKPSVNDDFVCKKHVKFFKRCLDVLPAAYSSLDTSRFVHRVIDRYGIVPLGKFIFGVYLLCSPGSFLHVWFTLTAIFFSSPYASVKDE